MQKTWVVGVVQDVVALNWKYEWNKYVISKDKHVSELLADDIPGGQHFLFIPEIVQHVNSSWQLVGPHATGYVAVLLPLFGQEGKV